MLIKIILIESKKVRNNDYYPVEITAQLIKRSQIDSFITTWYDLCRDTTMLYENQYYGKDYLKVYIGEDNKILHHGSMLTVDELRCKIKHFTRIDLPLNKNRG